MNIASQLIAKSGLIAIPGVLEKRNIAVGLGIHQLTVHRQFARVLPYPSDGTSDGSVPTLIIEEHGVIVVVVSFLNGQPCEWGMIIVRPPDNAVRHAVEVAAIVLACTIACSVVRVKESKAVSEGLGQFYHRARKHDLIGIAQVVIGRGTGVVVTGRGD